MSAHPTIKYGKAFDAFLFKALPPGLTVNQLCNLLDSKKDTVCHHLEALHDEGLAYRAGHTPTGACIWAWQPQACLMPDHVREVGKSTQALKRNLKRIQHLNMGLIALG